MNPLCPVRLICLAFTLLFVLLAAAPGRADAGPWEWPVDGGPPEILREFDPPPQRWLPGHRGVDLAAEPGAEIRAAGAGRVSFAGVVAGTPVVVVTHGELRTTYLPVESSVARGDEVAAGEAIGVLAETPRHCRDQPCLHWGLLRGADYLDPLALLGLGEIRLLPLDGPSR